MRLVLLLLSALALRAEERFVETLYPAWGQSFEVSKTIHTEKSDYWNLAIFENPLFGRVLAIDGIIQTTERDEAIYHEMMAHVPLLAHGNAKSVLILGGGDGGTLREALRHPGIERAVLVEIDRRVMDLCKEHMPSLSSGAFDDPRASIVIQDASKYVKETSETFDVIICDSSDPFGPGKVLFTSEFYGDCKARLNPNGIFVNQNGVPFLQKEELLLTLENRRPHFKHVSFYAAPVPTYAGGFMAFGWASDRKYKVSEQTLKKRLENLKGEMKYYTPAIHRASFALPAYMLP
jgi:spermidine synthase